MKKIIINEDILLFSDIEDFDFVSIEKYLNDVDDWKTGTKACGSEIKRLQKWFHLDNNFFSEQWNKRPKRWISCRYDSFLLDLQSQMQKWVEDNKDIPNIEINSLLINKYRTKEDYIKKHRDSSYAFGTQPTIINMSIGSEREIIFTEKETGEEIKLNLPSKSILVMKNNSQVKYLHEIPKIDKERGIRFSLTWREHNKKNI